MIFYCEKLDEIICFHAINLRNDGTVGWTFMSGENFDMVASYLEWYDWTFVGFL